ncbi:MAG: ADOP family duplicated permease [Myxococcaceae bacterium]
MSSLRLAIRQALRRMARAPAFAAGVILTLGLCIAANAVIATGVEGVLLRALPFRDPSRLVWIWSTRTDRDRAFFSLPNLEDTRARSTRLDALVGLAPWGVNLTGGGTPVRLAGIRASGELGALLGVSPALGRMLEPADDNPTRPAVVLLGHRLWVERFGRSASVLGATVTLDGEPAVVVGVLPEAFSLPNLSTELLAPLRAGADPRRNERGSNFLRVIGHLAPGATLSQAQQELADLTADLAARYPEEDAKLAAPRVRTLQEEWVGSYRTGLLLLGAAGLLLLLIATANLSSLFLARVAARRAELSMRWALGATRAALVVDLTAEAALLAGSGAALGLGLAWLGQDLLRRLAPGELPRLVELGLDWRIALYTAGLLLAVTALLVAGAATAASVPRSAAGLGTHATAGPGALRLRAGLVSAEAGLAAVLLVAVGLLWRSEAVLLQVDPGLRTAGLSVTRVSLPRARYRTPASLRDFHDALRDRRAGEDAEGRLALVNVLPLSGINSRTDFDILDRPAPTRATQPGGQTRWVSPAYFEVAGIPVREGRSFGPDDDANHPRVVVVDEALARAYWPDGSPIGAMLHVSFTAEPAADYRVVGVVGNVKHESLAERPAGTLYAPLYQVPGPVVPYLSPGLSILVRSGRPGPGLARRLADAIHGVDPEIPLSPVQPGESLQAAVLAARRAGTHLLQLFAAAALALCLTGLYAVLAYAQVQRRRELAIRSALGATPGAQAASVFGVGLRWVGTGALLGTGLGAVVAHAFAGLLFGVDPVDGATLAGVLVLLLLTAVLASAPPALRAAHTSPGPALTAE